MGGESSGAFDPQGPIARAIADLWWMMLALGTATFVVFAVVLAVGLRRGSASAEGPSGDRPNRFIVRGGVVLPAVVLVVVMVLTVKTMRDVSPTAPAGTLPIEVIGHRWWYEIRYPQSGVVTANEIHLPVGRPVEFRLTSADVIHSFWIPALGGKMDLLPDDVNTLVLEADEPGVHHSQCAEFCGLQHAKMALIAVAEPEDEFNAWLTGQGESAPTPATALSQRGQEVFLHAGCASCHTVRGHTTTASAGPDLTHLATRRTLAAATLPNTKKHLARWVVDPHDVKRGVAMPPAELDAQQLEALLSYLESLE